MLSETPSEGDHTVFHIFWVADEPGGREWEVDELAFFSLNTDQSRPTTPIGIQTGHDAVCAIDRLKVYVEAVDDFERDDLYQAITNLTMQWLARQALQNFEPFEHRVKLALVRARNLSMNGQSTRVIPNIDRSTFNAVQMTLSARFRELNRLELNSVPRFADHIDNTDGLWSCLKSKTQHGSPSATANAPEKPVSDSIATLLDIGIAATPSQAPDVPALKKSPMFVYPLNSIQAIEI
ncbi:hypothetical protein G7Y79_00010g027650 [Physcia stellaris]|nr:hypothetical protein G7Y79_00010g027650 [Physcia stellaris]